MAEKRHLYQRTVGKSKAGKAVKAWYYWYYDGDRKQVRRSCGQDGQYCLLKREAEKYLAELEAADSAGGSGAALPVRFRDVAETMYQTDSKHMRLREERGRAITDTTQAECRGYLDKLIIPKWGDRLPASIDGAEIEDWLIEQDRSNSWRNRVLEIMSEVFSECIRYKIMTGKPPVTRFKRNGRKQGVLTTEEIRKLFPGTPEALEAVWRDTDPRDPPGSGICFGALFALMISTGLRSGEARAISPGQLDRTRGGIVINQAFDAQQRIVKHLKKGTDDDPRLRVVLVPTRAMKMLDWWIDRAPKTDTGLIFSYRGHSINKDHLVERFSTGLANAKIEIADRKLTPHALRYTYNTRMRRLIPGEFLRMMTGHQDEAMTDHYTRTELDGQLVSLQPYRKHIESFWEGEVKPKKARGRGIDSKNITS